MTDHGPTPDQTSASAPPSTAEERCEELLVRAAMAVADLAHAESTDEEELTVVLRHAELARTGYTTFSVVDEDGATRRSRASDDVQSAALDGASDALAELRGVMYEPDVGTWYTVVLSVSGTGRTGIEFIYDEAPIMGASGSEVGAGGLRADFQKYPRDEAHTPPWLADKLEEARRGVDRLQRRRARAEEKKRLDRV